MAKPPETTGNWEEKGIPSCGGAALVRAVPAARWGVPLPVNGKDCAGRRGSIRGMHFDLLISGFKMLLGGGLCHSAERADGTRVDGADPVQMDFGPSGFGFAQSPLSPLFDLLSPKHEADDPSMEKHCARLRAALGLGVGHGLRCPHLMEQRVGSPGFGCGSSQTLCSPGAAPRFAFLHQGSAFVTL